MGNWTIVIHGTGVHHNPDLPQDADKMSAAFVEQLRQAGHTIQGATFTYGARQNLEKA
jgi:hypothetical protein